MINKNRFTKLNDKKVLHKVKKHWVTISVAMLGMIGASAIQATVTHASTNPDNDNQGSSVKTQVNSNLSHAYQQTQQPSAQPTTLAQFAAEHSNPSATNVVSSAKQIAQNYAGSGRQSNGQSSVASISNQAKNLAGHLMTNHILNNNNEPINKLNKPNQSQQFNLQQFNHWFDPDNVKYNTEYNQYKETMNHLGKTTKPEQQSQNNDNQFKKSNDEYNQELREFKNSVTQYSNSKNSLNLFKDNFLVGLDDSSKVPGSNFYVNNKNVPIPSDKGAHIVAKGRFSKNNDNGSLLNNGAYWTLDSNNVMNIFNGNLPQSTSLITNASLFTNSRNNIMINLNLSQFNKIRTINLVNVDFPRYDTNYLSPNLFANENGPAGVFPSLTSFNFYNVDTSKVCNFTAGFNNIKHLQYMKGLGEFNAGNVSDISQALDGDPSLIYLDLSRFNTRKAIRRGGLNDLFSGFYGTSKILALRLGPDTILNNECGLHGTYANSKGVVTNLVDGRSHPGIWYLVGASNHVRINYIYNGQQVGSQQIPYLRSSPRIDSTFFTAPNGYFNPANIRTYHINNDNPVINTNVYKLVPINYYFGSNRVGGGETVVNHDGTTYLNYADFDPSNFSGLPNGYEVDPHLVNGVPFSSNGANNKIQVYKVGKWGSAKYGLDSNGDLYVSNGAINGSIASILKTDASSVKKIVLNHVSDGSTPDEFANLPNLTNLNVNNLNVNATTNLNDMFKDDSKFNDWSSIVNDWAFNNKPTVRGMLSNTNMNNGEDPQVSYNSGDGKWHFDAEPVNINVSYEDPNGDVVGSNSISGVPGHVITLNERTLRNVPSGYNLVNSNSKYNVSSEPNRSVIVNVVGNSTGKATINYVNQHGVTVSTQNVTNGTVGDPVSINAPHGYQVEPNWSTDATYGTSATPVTVNIIGKPINSDVTIHNVIYHRGDGTTSNGSTTVHVSGRVGDLIHVYQRDLAYSSGYNASMSSATMEGSAGGVFYWANLQGNYSQAPSVNYWAYGAMANSASASANNDRNATRTTSNTANTDETNASNSENSLMNAASSLEAEVEFLDNIAAENQDNASIQNDISSLASDWSNASVDDNTLSQQVSSVNDLASEIDSYAGHVSDIMGNIGDDESEISNNNDAASANTTEGDSNASVADARVTSENDAASAASNAANNELNQLNTVDNSFASDQTKFNNLVNAINGMENTVSDAVRGVDANAIYMVNNDDVDVGRLDQVDNRQLDSADQADNSAAAASNTINADERAAGSNLAKLPLSERVSLSSQAASYSEDYQEVSLEMVDDATRMARFVSKVSSASTDAQQISSAAQSVYANADNETDSEMMATEASLASASASASVEADAAQGDQQVIAGLHRNAKSASLAAASDVAGVSAVASNAASAIANVDRSQSASENAEVAQLASSIDQLNVSGATSEASNAVDAISSAATAVSSIASANADTINSAYDMSTFTSYKADAANQQRAAKSDQNSLASAVNDFHKNVAAAKGAARRNDLSRLVNLSAQIKADYQQVAKLQANVQKHLAAAKSDVDNANGEVSADESSGLLM